MSGYPFDHSFHPSMSQCLLRLAANFKIDNTIVPWDELISSDTLMNELGHALSRCGWPSRTFEEIQKELLRLHERWKKIEHKSEPELKFAAKHTFLWTDDSGDEDDIFMPLLPGSASSKGKTSASSKGKSSASSKGKSYASSKGKSSPSSNGKSSASTEDDDDAFM